MLTKKQQTGLLVAIIVATIIFIVGPILLVTLVVKDKPRELFTLGHSPIRMNVPRFHY